MTAFLGVWLVTRDTCLLGGSLTVSLRAPNWGLPNRAAFRQGPFACDVQTAELPEGFGLEPLSTRTGARPCILSVDIAAIAGLEPARYRVACDSSTTEPNGKAPFRRGRPSRFPAFWARKYNTLPVVRLPAT